MSNSEEENKKAYIQRHLQFAINTGWSMGYKNLEKSIEDLSILVLEHIATLVNQRDESRREICELRGKDQNVTPQVVAELRNWDCFSKELES